MLSTHKARFKSILVILAMLFSFTNVSLVGAASTSKPAVVRTNKLDIAGLRMMTAATVSETFNYTGGVQTWTVPAGVTQVTIDVFGAKAGNESAVGGNGGQATATIAVTPGDTLTIVVGGMSQSPFLGGSPIGGFNGGGNGGAPFSLPAAYSGSGGGGASDVRIGGTDLANRVIVAGGGGGAAAVFGPDGPSYGGAGGGLTGNTGNTAYTPYAATGGAGGNQNGSAGSGDLGLGSSAATSTSTIFNGVGAGGGGGGYYGGAAGSPGTGGGGGSGFGPAGTVFATGVNGGNGKVTVSYANICAAGTYDNGSNCVNADPGYYVDFAGATSQTPCNIGFYQPVSGATSCFPAVPGKYAPSTGMIVATDCALGSYQPNAGSSSCILASPGYFVDTIGAVAQSLCPVGYTSLDGAAFCSPIDNLSPTASPIQSPAANIAGWNNSDVTVTWNWADNEGGSGIDNANCTMSSTSSGEGYAILLSATCKDLAGNTGSASYTLKVDKTGPVTSAGGPYTGSESAPIVLNNASAVDALNPGSVTSTWSVNSALCSFSDVNALNPNLTCSDNGSFTATLTASDGLNTISSNATVTVSNVAPTLGAITIPTYLVPINTVINASAPFTDPGTLDSHTAVWNWEDTTTSTGSISPITGSGTASASHSYALTGVYLVRLNLKDKDNASSNQSIFEFVVVYDPNAGFVTGGGSINSPVGAYVAKPTAIGSGKLGFNTKYKKDGSLESETEFELASVKFHFHSHDATWLVVSTPKAEFQGTGTVEGSTHHYGFTLTLIDGQATGGGGVDKFRLRIWDVDNANAIVYDNQMGAPVNANPTTPLSGGSIVMHK